MQNNILNILISILQKRTNRDQIDINGSFSALGITSLMAIQLIAEINTVTDASLKTHDLFLYPTPQSLAAYIETSKNKISDALNLKSNKKNKHLKHEPIAIIAMDCKYPGADNCEVFWENCSSNKESITFFKNGAENLNHNSSHEVYARGILNNIEYFDAQFFNFSPKEAHLSDPQHRLFIESAWTALEKAGYATNNIDYRIGVFASMNDSTYIVDQSILQQYEGNLTDRFALQRLMSSQFLATKVAYLLNCTGPSFTMQTACSSSLVAVVLACQQLASFTCDIAIAGGVSIITPQNRPYVYQPGNIHSPDGHCRPFDAKAEGTVFSNGLGIVVLKRLSDAIKDRDTIISVIKGYSNNNDGSHKMSYAAPAMQGQLDCILDAQTMAKVEANSIQYMEAHGTGTLIGDPIEIEALSKAFRATTSKEQFCALGSVKANIGHTHVAAGVAGLIKTSLALQNKQLPPLLNFTKPNPDIDFKHSPFYINTRLFHWRKMQYPRRAAVSAFGVGGTNAHIILEEAPILPTKSSKHTFHSLLLSAKSQQALNDYQDKLIEFLEKLQQNPGLSISLADIAYTLQLGRNHYSYRSGIVCKDIEDALIKLKTDKKKDYQPIPTDLKRHKKIVFLFSGEKISHFYLSKSLYGKEPIYKKYLDECFQLISKNLNISLSAIIKQKKFPQELSDLILFSIQFSLAKLLQHWGIIPSIVWGEKIGEYVAGCIAGAFSLQDAIKLAGSNESIAISTSMPQIQYLSNLAKDWGTENNLHTNSKLQNSLEASAECAEKLLAESENTLFIEIGFSNNLIKFLQQHSSTPLQTITLPPDQKTSKENEELLIITSLKDLWCQGCDINWKNFYDHEKRNRVTLPTYPFQKQYFWFDQILSSHQQKIEFYSPTWICDPKPPSSSTFMAEKSPIQRWIIFATHSDLCQKTCQSLISKGADIVKIFQEHDRRNDDSNALYINPKNKIDYDNTLSQCTDDKITHYGIIHFWGLETSSVKNSEFTNDLSLYQNLYSGIFITQALGQTSSNATISWTIVATNTQPTLGNELIEPLKSSSLSLCRVLPLENAKFRMCHIDVELTSDASTINLYANDIINQTIHPFLFPININTQAKIIALRHQKRWLLSYTNIGHFNDAIKHNIDIPDNSTYLITGGLGGMGLTFAQWLSEKNRNITLILLSRSDFPEQSLWNKWLSTHSHDHEISKKILLLQKIVKNGCHIEICQADIADDIKMKEIINHIEEKYGSIRGILHLAGIAGKGIAALKKLGEVQSVLKSKVQGTKTLLTLFHEKPLDFFVTASSLTAIAGGVGQIDYCAANLFLDYAITPQTLLQCKKLLTINWNSWRAVGMATNLGFATHCRLYAENSVTPDQGISILEQLLSMPYSQVIVSRYSPQDEVIRIKKMFSSIRPQSETSSPTNTQSAQSQSTVYEIMKQGWQNALGITDVKDSDSFYDCGGDSLTILQLIATLEKHFDIKIPIQDLMGQSNFQSMTKFVETLINQHRNATTS